MRFSLKKIKLSYNTFFQCRQNRKWVGNSIITRCTCLIKSLFQRVSSILREFFYNLAEFIGECLFIYLPTILFHLVLFIFFEVSRICLLAFTLDLISACITAFYHINIDILVHNSKSIFEGYNFLEYVVLLLFLILSVFIFLLVLIFFNYSLIYLFYVDKIRDTFNRYIY